MLYQLRELMRANRIKLYGILDLQNTQSNNMLATQSQKYNQEIENMTRKMEAIAQQTKEETISMKVITLVALWFLPGTLIAVRCLIPMNFLKDKHFPVVRSRKVFLFLDLLTLLDQI